MIGALGHAKTLPGIIMGCETVDVNGRPFTPVVPNESVSDPTLRDSLIPVGRFKEDGFDVSFRVPVEAHIDGVDIDVYPKYGSKIITPGPDSRTVFMEYEKETWLVKTPDTDHVCTSCDSEYFFHTCKTSVRIQGSRPGIMLTCIVRFMAITPIVSEREGLQ